jgi:hypothetical protein
MAVAFVRFGIHRILMILALVLGMAAPAFADEAAQALAVRHMEAGTLAAGESELAALIARDPVNNDARFGLGGIQFLIAIEHLAQGLYRYGLSAPNSIVVPVLRLPVPPNPNPERITYTDFRDLLARFVNDLGKAEATLGAMSDADARLPVDLAKIRYDANADGIAGSGELFAAVIARVMGTGVGADENALTVVAFDRADAYWLQGYANVLMALGQLLLAHDWHRSFDAGFHVFFPNADTPFVKELSFSGNEWSRERIIDVISFLHIAWPVVEPVRMQRARGHLKTVIALSRKSWTAIEAETDDHREWLPGPRQVQSFTGILIGAEQVAAWRAVLDETEAILDGRKLVPHWRLERGINLRRVFDEPQPFDLVLWITGPAAVPYLESGPVTTREDWNRILQAFGSQFGRYAIWFN